MKRIWITTALLLAVVMGLGLVAGCSNANDTGQDKVIKLGHAPYDYEVPFIEITKLIGGRAGLPGGSTRG